GTIDRAKQHRAEAAPGPDGDDNGPGSEPPPHGRFRYVSTFVTSRRRPPAAVGKPSFTYFPVDCLPHDVLRPDEPTDLREGDLPDATSYERSEDIGPKRRKQRIGAVYPASAKTDSFNIVLPSQQFWPAVEIHHEQQWPPHLPSQHPIVQLKSERSSSSLAHSKSNMFTPCSYASLEGSERRRLSDGSKDPDDLGCFDPETVDQLKDAVGVAVKIDTPDGYEAIIPTSFKVNKDKSITLSDGVDDWTLTPDDSCKTSVDTRSRNLGWLEDTYGSGKMKKFRAMKKKKCAREIKKIDEYQAKFGTL
ncbi:hypothetical protein THAOC_14290, partial [Thalassiosira oceanica]